MKINRIARYALTLIIANCLGIIAITYDMERIDKIITK